MPLYRIICCAFLALDAGFWLCERGKKSLQRLRTKGISLRFGHTFRGFWYRTKNKGLALTHWFRWIVLRLYLVFCVYHDFSPSSAQSSATQAKHEQQATQSTPISTNVVQNIGERQSKSTSCEPQSKASQEMVLKLLPKHPPQVVPTPAPVAPSSHRYVSP